MERNHLLMWCRKKTNNEHLIDEDDFSFVLNQLESLIESIGVTSENISDMSQTFSVDTNSEIMKLLSPYRKAKFI